MSFNWDDGAVLLLIEKYHENDILWNPNNADYKNRSKRNNALNVIASTFNIDKSEVERKLKNLTSHYFREKKKLEESRKFDADTDIQEPKWFAYKPLNFLRDKTKPPTNTEKSFQSHQNKETPSSSRKRKFSTDEESDIGEALQMLKNVSASISARDDASVFGEYIASKIRKMDPITISTVEHLIQNIIYQAEMGAYSRPMMAAQDCFFTSRPESARPSTGHSNYVDNLEIEIKEERS